jgi:hypothetical protein
MLQPTITTVNMAAVSPTVTTHIAQPADSSAYTLTDEALLQHLMFLDEDYDEAVDQLWDAWYKDGINLIVQNTRVSEKWRTEWSEKEKKIFFRIKFIVDYIEAHYQEKKVGLLITELKKLQGKKKLSTLATKLKSHIKMAGQK